MAKRRKRHKRISSGITRKHRATPRRRRRMSAGSPAKMLNNPIAGSIAGGVAALLVGKLLKKVMPNTVSGEIVTFAPAIAGFLLRKKMPYVAAGMIAAPAVSFLQSKISFLQEDNSLFAGSPLLLSQYNEPLLLSEQGYSLAEGYDDDPDSDIFG